MRQTKTRGKMQKFQIDPKNLRLLKFAFFGTICVVFAYTFVVFDPLDVIIKSQLSIREGSYLFGVFKKPPLEVFISIYLFNVTNVDAFVNKRDAKLNLQEVGPYVYQEILIHTNYTFHENGTLTYFPERKVIFNRERSIGDPDVDIVTVPNIPMLGASTAAAKMSIFASMAFGTLVSTLNSQPMLNMTVSDYLWGYEDSLVKLASNILPNVITFERFGILDRMFDEGVNQITMNLPHSKSIDKNKEHIEKPVPVQESLRAYYEDYDDNQINLSSKIQESAVDETTSKNVPVVREYSINTWNGQKGLDYWGYDEKTSSKNTACNTLQGSYDGTVFPQNISKNEEFRVYRKAFCRTLPIRFDHADKVDGIDAYFFELTENAFDSDMDDPNSSCFCENGQCLRKGLGNITPCYYNIPAAVSYPHFYRSDPSLMDMYTGLNPDGKKHGSEIILQPQLGVPMRVHSRIQTNLLLGETKFNRRAKPFDNLVLPIVWMEIGVDQLTPQLYILLHLLFNILPYIQAGLIYLLCITGVSLFAVAALSYFCIPRSNKEYNPKKDIRYSAIHWFPYIKREFEKYTDEEQPKIYETA